MTLSLFYVWLVICLFLICHGFVPNSLNLLLGVLGLAWGVHSFLLGRLIVGYLWMGFETCSVTYLFNAFSTWFGESWV